MPDIDVKLKPVPHTPYRISCIAPLLEHIVSVCRRPRKESASVSSDNHVIHEEKNSTDDGNG